MKTSPTQRTLKLLRAQGWTVQIVERWNPFAKIRQDLFGGIDLVALKPGVCLGVQCTSATNHSARVAKLRAEPKLAAWVASGCRLEVISWGLKGERGKRKTWQERRETVEYFVERIDEPEATR